MGNFIKVFNFENKIRIKQKSFIVSLVLLFVVGIVVNIVPTIISNTSSNDSTGPGVISEENIKEGLLLLDSKDMDEGLFKFLDENYNISLVKSLDEMKKELEDKNSDFTYGVEIIGLDKANVISNSSSFSNPYDDLQYKLNTYKRQVAYKEAGINLEDVDKISNIGFDFSVESFGKDPAVGIVLATGGIFAIYLIVIIFGSLIATSVCREKESRTMELLVTNIKPKFLIIGKVVSGVYLGILNILTLFIGSLIGLYLSKIISKTGDSFLFDTILKIGLDQVGVFLLFLLLGTLLYYMMFAASASLVSKIEEVNSAVMPVTSLVIISFFATMFNMTNPDSLIIKIASFVPFSSPMAMFFRYCIGNVGAIDFLISLFILILTIILVSILAIKIYRFGSLNYGNKIGIKRIIKGLKDN